MSTQLGDNSTFSMEVVKKRKHKVRLQKNEASDIFKGFLLSFLQFLDTFDAVSLPACRYTLGWVRVKKWVKILTPSKIIFLSSIINIGLGQVHYSHFGSPRTPGGVWGALGGFGGVFRPQKYHYCSVTNLSPGMQCFGLKQLVTLCFWCFGSNGVHLGQKKAVFGPNRVCKKVDFSQKHHLQIC